MVGVHVVGFWSVGARWWLTLWGCVGLDRQAAAAAQGLAGGLSMVGVHVVGFWSVGARWWLTLWGCVGLDRQAAPAAQGLAGGLRAYGSCARIWFGVR
jgi:hypothetical protein